MKASPSANQPNTLEEVHPRQTFLPSEKYLSGRALLSELVVEEAQLGVRKKRSNKFNVFSHSFPSTVKQPPVTRSVSCGHPSSEMGFNSRPKKQYFDMYRTQRQKPSDFYIPYKPRRQANCSKGLPPHRLKPSFTNRTYPTQKPGSSSCSSNLPSNSMGWGRPPTSSLFTALNFHGVSSVKLESLNEGHSLPNNMTPTQVGPYT